MSAPIQACARNQERRIHVTDRKGRVLRAVPLSTVQEALVARGDVSVDLSPDYRPKLCVCTACGHFFPVSSRGRLPLRCGRGGACGRRGEREGLRVGDRLDVFEIVTPAPAWRKRFVGSAELHQLASVRSSLGGEPGAKVRVLGVAADVVQRLESHGYRALEIQVPAALYAPLARPSFEVFGAKVTFATRERVLVGFELSSAT